jgi:hypothetical protein
MPIHHPLLYGKPGDTKCVLYIRFAVIESDSQLQLYTLGNNCQVVKLLVITRMCGQGENGESQKALQQTAQGFLM